jgi:hypothetical protein
MWRAIAFVSSFPCCALCWPAVDSRRYTMNQFRCYRRTSLVSRQLATCEAAATNNHFRIQCSPQSSQSVSAFYLEHSTWHFACARIQGFMNNNISVDDITRRICRVPQKVACVFVHRRRRRVTRAVSLTLATSTMGRELGGEHRPIVWWWFREIWFPVTWE